MCSYKSRINVNIAGPLSSAWTFSRSTERKRLRDSVSSSCRWVESFPIPVCWSESRNKTHTHKIIMHSLSEKWRCENLEVKWNFREYLAIFSSGKGLFNPCVCTKGSVRSCALPPYDLFHVEIVLLWRIPCKLYHLCAIGNAIFRFWIVLFFQAFQNCGSLSVIFTRSMMALHSTKTKLSWVLGQSSCSWTCSRYSKEVNWN